MTTSHLHLDHLADPDRAVVLTKRIGNIVQIVSWTVHGDKAQALHDINTLKLDEIELLRDAADWIRVMASQVLGARRDLPDDIGGIVLGAGPGRAI